MDCLRSTCYTPAIGNIGCERLLAIWSANVVRITLLTVIGTSVSAGVALGGFHSQAGWLTLDGMAYAAALYRRGRVGEALYAHMTTNALIAGYVL